MLRHGLSILAASLAIWPAASHGEDAKELKIIATFKEVTDLNGIGPIAFKTKNLAVIRSAEELVAASNKAESAKDSDVQKEMTTAMAKLLKVDAIDWSKQMIMVGVVEGFDSLKSDGKKLTVTYSRYNERPLRFVPPFPKVVVLTERFESEVKFVPSEKKADPKK
jgi:hypothetical protein